MQDLTQRVNDCAVRNDALLLLAMVSRVALQMYRGALEASDGDQRLIEQELTALAERASRIQRVTAHNG